RPRPQQVLLADDLVQRTRTHPHREGSVTRDLVLGRRRVRGRGFGDVRIHREKFILVHSSTVTARTDTAQARRTFRPAQRNAGYNANSRFGPNRASRASATAAACSATAVSASCSARVVRSRHHVTSAAARLVGPAPRVSASRGRSRHVDSHTRTSWAPNVYADNSRSSASAGHRSTTSARQAAVMASLIPAGSASGCGLEAN